MSEKKQMTPLEFAEAVLGIILMLALIRVVILLHEPIWVFCKNLSWEMTRAIMNLFGAP